MTEITRQDVLAALMDFESSGGASLELIAWEFDVEVRAFAEIWRELHLDGLIHLDGEDPINGEQMYRLTETGQRACS